MEALLLAVISIHAPRTGSDSAQRRAAKTASHFNPRSPHGERHSVHRQAGQQQGNISIHAPRTGSDRGLRHKVAMLGISIHAPRTGSDAVSEMVRVLTGEFQSTLPARGATRPCKSATQRRRYFNPRSPHGERPGGVYRTSGRTDFNPRSPHGERQTTSRFAYV